MLIARFVPFSNALVWKGSLQKVCFCSSAILSCAYSQRRTVHGSRTDHVMVRAALRTLSNAESIEMIAQKTGQRVQDVERDYKKRFHQPVRLPVARAIV